jgi:hypothetical protein
MYVNYSHAFGHYSNSSSYVKILGTDSLMKVKLEHLMLAVLCVPSFLRKAPQRKTTSGVMDVVVTAAAQVRNHEQEQDEAYSPRGAKNVI